MTCGVQFSTECVEEKTKMDRGDEERNGAFLKISRMK
jgi:hypothetical protein